MWWALRQNPEQTPTAPVGVKVTCFNHFTSSCFLDTVQGLAEENRNCQ